MVVSEVECTKQIKLNELIQAYKIIYRQISRRIESLPK